MPFDNATWVEDLSFAKGREGLRRLALLLRREDEFKEKYGMRWDFQWGLRYYAKKQHGCGTAGCAMGLAYSAWPEFGADVEVTSYKYGIGKRRVVHWGSLFSVAANHFEISYQDVESLFGSPLAWSLNKYTTEVTPIDVADAIDRYLSETE